MKLKVKGIILILSCQKYKYSRLKEFKLKKSNYNGYQVIYVLGDNRIKKNYILEDDMLTINCEDSYIHLLKKLVLALKYIYQIYDIEEGVLRCGDDLYFNEYKLLKFINQENKDDFIGNNWCEKGLKNPNIDSEYPTRNDYFMVQYYQNHKDDLTNPLHNLQGVNIMDYIKRPTIDIGVCGTLYYISNKCSKILIDHMKKINYNIFHFDNLTKSYPYTIEDCAVSFILYLNKIPFVCDKYFVKLYEKRTDDENYIASHTNKYRNLSIKSLDKCLIEKIIINNNNEKDIIKFFNESIKKCKKQELSIIFNKKSDKILNNFNILFSMIPDNFDILCINSSNINEIKSLNFDSNIISNNYDVFIVTKKFCKLYCALLKYLNENNQEIKEVFLKYIYNFCISQKLNIFYNYKNIENT